MGQGSRLNCMVGGRGRGVCIHSGMCSVQGAGAGLVELGQEFFPLKTSGIFFSGQGPPYPINGHVRLKNVSFFLYLTLSV